MGSLKTLELLDEEKAETSFRSEVESTLRNGAARDIFGIPNPIPVVKINDETLLEEQIDSLEGDGFSKAFVKSYVNMLKGVDAIPEAAAASPIGIKDPTSPLLPVIDTFLETLEPLTSDPPKDWVISNLPSIIDKSELFLVAVGKIGNPDSPDTKPMANLLNQIDSSIDKKEAEEKLQALVGARPFGSMPQEASTDDFSNMVSFPSTVLDPNELGLPTIPSGFTAVDPSLEFKNVNWAFLSVFQALTDGIKGLMGNIQGLITKILDGIEGFLGAIIEALLGAIVSPIIEALEPMMKCALFSATVATLISLLIGSVVVAMIGFLMGTGLVAFSIANLLGLFG